MTRVSVRTALLTSCVLAPFVSPLSAAAQVAPAPQEQVASAPGEPDHDVVIVTALKQGEALLETPATVAVVEPGELGALNITSANELGGIIPGYVTMQGTAGASNSFRGLGSNSADPGIESSVATFVDGVYLGHTRDLVMPLFDLESIEFIPGTQSTLLGKNTSLGAVAITNRTPGDVFAYDLTASYTSELEAKRIQGGVDIPLGEGLRARLSGIWNDEEGFLENQYLNRPERQAKESSGRLTLSGDIGDTGTITFVYQHDERDTDGHYIEVLSDPNGDIEGLALFLGQTNFDPIGNDTNFSASEAIEPGEIAGPGQLDNQSGDRASLTGSFDLGGGFNLTTVTGFVDWDADRVTDLDFTRGRLVDLIDGEKNQVLSQEVRINYEDGGPFSYLAGVFYYKNDWKLDRTIFTQSGGVSPLFGDQVGYTNVDTEAWSLFGSGTLELSDQWSVQAGLRYTTEDKTGTFQRTTSGIFDFIATPLPYTTLPTEDSGELDGDLGVRFYPNDSTMLYATVARGSKSGGYQSSPDTLDVAAFDGEAAYTAEAGAKFDLGAQGSATFAIFNTTVDGFQVSRVQDIGGFPQVIIDNSEIRSRGFEGSLDWNATDNLTFDASVTFAESQFTKDLFSDDGAGGQVLEAYEGMVVPRAPKWTAKAGAHYETQVGNNLTFRADGILRYASSADLQFRASNPLAPKSDAHTTLDLQLGLGASDGGWEVVLVGNNLTDDRYVTFTSDAPLSDGGYYGTLNRPRTVGLQLKVTG